MPLLRQVRLLSFLLLLIEQSLPAQPIHTVPDDTPQQLFQPSPLTIPMFNLPAFIPWEINVDIQAWDEPTGQWGNTFRGFTQRVIAPTSNVILFEEINREHLPNGWQNVNSTWIYFPAILPNPPSEPTDSVIYREWNSNVNEWRQKRKISYSRMQDGAIIRDIYNNENIFPDTLENIFHYPNDTFTWCQYRRYLPQGGATYYLLDSTIHYIGSSGVLTYVTFEVDSSMGITARKACEYSYSFPDNLLILEKYKRWVDTLDMQFWLGYRKVEYLWLADNDGTRMIKEDEYLLPMIGYVPFFRRTKKWNTDGQLLYQDFEVLNPYDFSTPFSWLRQNYYYNNANVLSEMIIQEKASIFSTWVNKEKWTYSYSAASNNSIPIFSTTLKTLNLGDGNFELQFDNLIPNDFLIFIFDVSGHLVSKKEGQRGQKIDIDLTSATPGVYFVHLEFSNGGLMVKLIR